MNLQLAANLYLLACSGISLVCGIIRILGKRKPPTYFLFIFFAVLSAFLSRIFYSISIAVYGAPPDIFNIGFLGYAAMLLFMFFANYGQIDLLVDDRKTLKAKYRIIPVIVPVIELTAGICGLLFGTVDFSVRASFLVISVIAGFAGYLNIKHLVVPDVDFGIVKSIRGYNLIAFLTGIFSLAEIGFSVFEYNGIIIYCQIILGILYAVMIPVLVSEVKKWTR